MDEYRGTAVDEPQATAVGELQATAGSRQRVTYVGATVLLVALLAVAISGWTERTSAKGDTTYLKREIGELQAAKSALTGQLHECSRAIDAAAETFMTSVATPSTAAITPSSRDLVRVIRILYCEPAPDGRSLNYVPS